MKLAPADDRHLSACGPGCRASARHAGQTALGSASVSSFAVRIYGGKSSCFHRTKSCYAKISWSRAAYKCWPSSVINGLSGGCNLVVSAARGGGRGLASLGQTKQVSRPNPKIRSEGWPCHVVVQHGPQVHGGPQVSAQGCPQEVINAPVVSFDIYCSTVCTLS